MKEQIIIRKATKKDILPVYKMGFAKELKNPSGNAPKKWWIEAFIKEKQFFYVAEIREEVIGFILAERTTGDCLLIQEIFVTPKSRKKGIGKSLLESLEKEAKKRKIKAIFLYSYDSKEAIEFYKSKGYEIGSKEREVIKFLK